MKGKQGLKGLLAVQDQRHETAKRWLAEGRCQVKSCPGHPTKILSFTSGHILALCADHVKEKENVK